MNKKELIKELEDKANTHRGTAVNYGVEIALDLVERLDEPQKPVVPQYVADWLEEYRNNTLKVVLNKFDDLKSSHPAKTWLWSEGKKISTSLGGGAQTIIAKARILGYEVEEQTDMNELVEKVKQWSIDKGLDKAESSKQMLKTVEEVGEVAAALARGDMNELKDGIGDVVVTLIILAQQNGMELEECLEQAYGVVSKRTGKMVGGVFVKEEEF